MENTPEFLMMETHFYLLVIWYVTYIVQYLLSYGTAYRLTKRGGDNGLILFLWLFVFGIISIVPGLGLYLWFKYRKNN